jgi:acyl-CoA thioesterase-2
VSDSPSSSSPSRYRRLVEILTLHPKGENRFLAPTPGEGPPRLFGGQVASQAVRAATLTVAPERLIHSLHAYFVRPGRPGVPLELTVDRTRDGRSFTTRRVTASQDGEAIFLLDASFHIAERGDEWQRDPLPDAPLPDEIGDNLPPGMSFFRMSNPFEIRPVRRGEGFPLHPCWVRLREPIPDDPALHASALTYVSDLAVIGSVRAPGSGMPWGGASLDHAVWFHRPPRVDQWLLFSVDPVVNFGARGLARGTFHTADGVLVASLAQEALLRPSG